MRQMINPDEVTRTLATIDLSDRGARIMGFWIEADVGGPENDMIVTLVETDPGTRARWTVDDRIDMLCRVQQAFRWDTAIARFTDPDALARYGLPLGEVGFHRIDSTPAAT